MFIQIQETPNPNSLKFIPGKKVSSIGSVELTKKEDTNNDLLKNILSVNGESKNYAPVYSHILYDVIPDEKLEIIDPDILIIEGISLSFEIIEIGRAHV